VIEMTKVKNINPKLKIKFTQEEAEYVLSLYNKHSYRALDEYLVMNHGYDCDDFETARLDALIALEAHGAYDPDLVDNKSIRYERFIVDGKDLIIYKPESDESDKSDDEDEDELEEVTDDN
jgi:hypothetical protein